MQTITQTLTTFKIPIQNVWLSFAWITCDYYIDKINKPKQLIIRTK